MDPNGFTTLSYLDSSQKPAYKVFKFSQKQNFKTTFLVTIVLSILIYLCHDYVKSVIVVAFIAYIVITLNSVVEERLLLAVPLRLQMTSVYILGQKTVTVPWENIADFFIFDEIMCQNVTPFLAVQLKNDVKSHITLFPNTRPRLPTLERIYSELQTIIDNNKTDY